MIKSYILFLFLISTASTVLAQNQTPFFKDWKLVASYYGNNLWNTGLQVAGEKVIRERTVRKNKKDQLKVNFRQHVIDAKIGFYYDNPTHLAVFNNYTYNLRRVRNKGKFLSVGVGPGVTRIFLPETYSVSNSGLVEKVKLPGRLYFSPTFSVGTGRLWKRKSSQPWQLKLHNTWFFNYNNGLLPTINIEYGYFFGYRSKEVSKDES